MAYGKIIEKRFPKITLFANGTSGTAVSLPGNLACSLPKRANGGGAVDREGACGNNVGKMQFDLFDFFFATFLSRLKCFRTAKLFKSSEALEVQV